MSAPALNSLSARLARVLDGLGESCSAPSLTTSRHSAAPGQAHGDHLGDWEFILLWADRLPRLPEKMFEHELLTARQEHILAEIIQRGIGEASDDSTPMTRVRLAEIDRGMRALHILVQANLRLVRSVAVSARTDIDFDDRITMGVRGLIRVAERYDADRARFSTYAMWWIRQSIYRGIDDEERLIRFPVHLATRIRALKRAFAQANIEWMTPIRLIPEDLLDGIKPRQFKRLRALDCAPVSLGDAVTPDADDDWWTRIPDEIDSIEQWEDDLLRSEVWPTLERLVGKVPGLSERDFHILELRFGRGTQQGATLDEIGQESGLTRERVRQIISKILRQEPVREALQPFAQERDLLTPDDAEFAPHIESSLPPTGKPRSRGMPISGIQRSTPKASNTTSRAYGHSEMQEASGARGERRSRGGRFDTLVHSDESQSLAVHEVEGGAGYKWDEAGTTPRGETRMTAHRATFAEVGEARPLRSWESRVTSGEFEIEHGVEDSEWEKFIALGLFGATGASSNEAESQRHDGD